MSELFSLSLSLCLLLEVRVTSLWPECFAAPTHLGLKDYLTSAPPSPLSLSQHLKRRCFVKPHSSFPCLNFIYFSPLFPLPILLCTPLLATTLVYPSSLPTQPLSSPLYSNHHFKFWIMSLTFRHPPCLSQIISFLSSDSSCSSSSFSSDLSK